MSDTENTYINEPKVISTLSPQRRSAIDTAMKLKGFKYTDKMKIGTMAQWKNDGRVVLGRANLHVDLGGMYYNHNAGKKVWGKVPYWLTRDTLPSDQKDKIKVHYEKYPKPNTYVAPSVSETPKVKSVDKMTKEELRAVIAKLG